MRKEIKDIDKKVVAHRGIHKRIMGSHAGGLLLTQLLYWSKIMKHKEFYKTDLELREELDMGKKQFYNLKKKIIASGIFSQKLKGIPARTFYQLNKMALEEMLEVQRGVDKSKKTKVQKGESATTRFIKKEQQVYAKGGNLLTPGGETNTEITQEITSESTTKKIIKKVFSDVSVDCVTNPSSTIALAGDQVILEGGIEERVEETFHPRIPDSILELDDDSGPLWSKEILQASGVVINAVNKSSELCSKRAKRAEQEAIENHFAEFWQKYPLKVGKKKAMVRYHQAVKKTSPERILAALGAQQTERETAERLGVWFRDPKHPSTWLSEECWGDTTMTEDQLKRKAAAKMQQKMTYSQMKRVHEEANLSPKQILFRKMAEEDKRANGGVDPFYA